MITTKLEEAVHAFAGLDARLPTDEARAYEVVVHALAELCSAVEHASQSGLCDDAIRALVRPARAVHARSPFWQRVYAWPRGVVGDYLTIEWLCEGKRQAPAGSVAAQLERHLFSFPGAEQHRNKVRWQADQIARAVRAGGSNVLSVACGGCRDLRACGDRLRGETRFVLNDVDEEALRFALGRLPELGPRVRVLPGNLLRALPRFRSAGPFDLIVAGGIFDYLDDGLFRRALARLTACLAPGGRLCLTNYAAPNPYRTWMRFFGDWELVERTEAQLTALVAAAVGDAVAINVSRDATGLAILLELRVPDARPGGATA
jgi:SAM-dependent methyltransferase